MNHPTKKVTDLGEATDDAAAAWQATKEKASEALQTGERYVREKPFPSIGIVFGFGFLIGLKRQERVGKLPEYWETRRRSTPLWKVKRPERVAGQQVY